jgi:DNA-binding transcriptional regulator LsrR (DeoR family)
MEYGPKALERINEMKRLRFVEEWTLQQIADKYGISRERVRQLIGNSGSRNSKFFYDQSQLVA